MQKMNMIKWIVANKYLHKQKKEGFNEHETSSLLQRNVYKNKKIGNPNNKWEMNK
jgi:hypothetical protein